MRRRAGQQALELVYGYTPTWPRCDECERIPADGQVPYFATLTQDRATGLWYCDPCAFKRGLLEASGGAQAAPG